MALTVPFNAIPLDQATATGINQAESILRYNGGLQLAVQNNLMSPEEATRRTLSFQPGPNAVVIIDENLTDYSTSTLPIPDALKALPQLRQATPEDLLVLSVSSILGMPNERDNTLINGISAPLADQWVLTPEANDGTRVSNAFASGGAFSLDGVHLTPRGNAFIANELIKVINTTFGSDIQPVNPSSFRTITLK